MSLQDDRPLSASRRPRFGHPLPRGAERRDSGSCFPHDRIFTPPWDADYNKQNEQVGRAVTAYPDRLIGVARINPTFGGEHTAGLLDRYVDSWNCRGVKLVAGYDYYRPNDMSVMGPLLDKCEEHDLTVLFHSGDAPRDLPSLQAQAAKRYPRVRFQLAHMGMHLFLWEAIIAAHEHDNIWCDMSQAFTYDIAIFLAEAGPGKLLYGTDAPYQSPRVESQKVLDATSDPERSARCVLRERAQGLAARKPLIRVSPLRREPSGQHYPAWASGILASRSEMRSWVVSRSYWLCSPIQKPGELPKKRASSKAVSAVMARSPWTME